MRKHKDSRNSDLRVDMKETCKIVQGLGHTPRWSAHQSWKPRISGSSHRLKGRNFRSQRMCYFTQQAIYIRNSLPLETAQTEKNIIWFKKGF